MTDPTLIALLDALLPGHPPLPPFSQSGIDPSPLADAAHPILGAIDAAAFQASLAAEVDRVARQRPEEFRKLLGQVLAAYYQAPAVQAAVGWRSEPPQPDGHRLSAGDEQAWQLLEKVRKRGRLWR